MSSGTRSASIRAASCPRSSTSDGTVNEGYGSNIEYDAQGEFVGIAADVYRITKDRAFLEAVFEPVVRASRFIDELCAKTNASHGPETRFHGLVAPSISHEGYSKPSFSYWDDYFALSAWRNCAFLAAEIGDENVAAYARAKGEEFAADLARSIRMTAAAMGRNVIPGSADRDDVDPHATAIAFEPCRVEDALPPELLPGTFDIAADFIKAISRPDFQGNYTPYIIRDLNAFVALGRYADAFALLSCRARRPEARRLARLGRGRLEGRPRTGLYRRYAAHLDRRRVRNRHPADADPRERNGVAALPRRAGLVVAGQRHPAPRFADRLRACESHRPSGAGRGRQSNLV